MVHVCEKDMQDMYWEIPKDQVLQSFNWAVSHLGDARRHPITYFAIHRGGDKVLDRLGKGCREAHQSQRDIVFKTGDDRTRDWCGCVPLGTKNLMQHEIR